MKCMINILEQLKNWLQFVVEFLLINKWDSLVSHPNLKYKNNLMMLSGFVWPQHLSWIIKILTKINKIMHIDEMLDIKAECV